MKKFLLTATLLVSSTLLFSQTKFGIKAGANFATMEIDDSESEFGATPSSITSFHFGGFAEFQLSPTIYFQPGLSISGKGYKVDYSASAGGYSASINAKFNPIYVEIPLNIIGKFNAGSGKVLIGGGPYLGYGISGKVKGDYVIDGPGTDEDISAPTDGDIEFGSGDEEVKPFDFGLNFLGGYEFKSGLILNLGYGLGFSNLSNLEDERSKHRVTSISIGYKFK